MSRDDDDEDRPRKKKRRRDDDDDDDDEEGERRPRKRRRDEDDDDDDEEGERRPRKRRRDDDEDGDDEEGERRPRKRRARDEDDEDDEEEERPRKKKKKKKKRPSRPMPVRLLVMATLAAVLGGLGFLGAVGMFFDSARSLYFAFMNPFADIAAGVGFGKGTAVVDFLASAFHLLMVVGLLAGSVALFLRRAIGRNLVVGSPLGMALVLLIKFIVIAVAFGGLFVNFLAGPIILGIIIHLIVAFVFLKLQEDAEVTAALR